MIVNVIGWIAIGLTSMYFTGSFIMARKGLPMFKNEVLAIASLAVAAICFK